VKRLAVFAITVAFLLVFFVPAALAAGGTPDRGPVLLSVSGPIDAAAGDRLDLLVVIDGDARISGEVRMIVVAGGTATLAGATTESLFVMGGTADLQAGTTVAGDVHTVGGTVTQQPGATVQGSVKALDADLAALAVLMIPVLIVLFIGMALAAIVAALVVAAFGARQVRGVEALIGGQPGQVLVSGIAGAVALPLLSILLTVTVVGAPIGFILLFVLLPVLAFLAWIVAAIWIGDWLVARLRGAPEGDRPYRAAFLGVVVLAVAGMIPFVTAIAMLFGFGALLLAGWRTLRREAPGAGETGEIGAVLPVATAG
jgi:hypothetical protein